ncbi:MAG TPA: hypothetical protein VMF55_08300 [Solirubrobacterales bacterium]|nr:hypothetical protein [Solirubrobacterales bacterium]
MTRRRIAVAAALVALATACVGGASAETIRSEDLLISFKTKLAPSALPRKGTAPINVSLGGSISTADGAPPPQLQTITFAISRHGRLDYRGLPACHYHQIQPASTAEALEACPHSIVGEGTFGAHVLLPEQSPFPSQGEAIAFNGIFHGDHVIYVQIYGRRPLPQSQVLVFHLGRTTGQYGVTMSAELPQVAANWGYVSGLSLKLGRTFTFKGKKRGFLSAGCPAPPGFPGATFAMARATFGFDDGSTLPVSTTGHCRPTD